LSDPEVRQDRVPGWDATTSHLIAEVEMAAELEWDICRAALGIKSSSSMGIGVR
jgi:hypothetical protein